MCGIWAFINLSNDKPNYNKLYNDFMSIQHRGPDLSSFQTIKNLTVGFHRLAIMDPNFHANQPYIIEDKHNSRTIVFVCNGEIYNFKELIEKHHLDIHNNSDCMTIPKLYIKYGYDKFQQLFNNDIKGEFAFLLFEFDKFQKLSKVVVGRDMIGIRPLYYSNINVKTTYTSDISARPLYSDIILKLSQTTYYNNSLAFSSEIKGLDFYDGLVSEYKPGLLTCINIDDLGFIGTVNEYNFNKQLYDTTFTYLNEEGYLNNVKTAVINSVKRRLDADKPIAFLLSGGVDSSLVASISSKLLGTQIKTYCCGMNEGTDLLYARKVAEHIGSNHTEVFFTPEEGLQAIRDVIRTTETWDTTTVRASVGQYLVCKHIGTKTDAKVVLVGEGPDEVCSSYLFNYYAPLDNDCAELHQVAKEYVEKIHMFDGRRADRCISRWGLEGRVALLDPEFIEAYWSIPAQHRHPKYNGIEKWWLRKAFDNTNILPNEVLWRKKEAFSDGVSSKTKSWFEIIQDHIKTLVTEEEFKASNEPSIEAYYYKKVFIEFFGEKRVNVLPHYWQPKWINKDGKYIDPSARVLNVY